MRLGIDVLLADKNLVSQLKSRRVALLAHPASVTNDLTHSIDALTNAGIKLSAAFGPQHGMRGEKQDNMIESDDYLDPQTKIKVYSLYGEVRRPTSDMINSFDVLLVDLQDVGCRIYTYLTTLFYLLEDCAKAGKAVWVLDRPNPAGRPVEGNLLEKGWESFVGMGAVPMRHGLTLGEIGQWIVKKYALTLEYRVVKMENYFTSESPGYGWPTGELAWVNPSPNMPVLCTARVYAGTVLLEGTNLSEGRGTTRPLQLFGAPKIEPERLIADMHKIAPDWLRGCTLRAGYFEPTFHKYKGELCAGVQIHVDHPAYDHQAFKPYRLMLALFRALKKFQPGILEWRNPPYEYELTRLPIDLLNGTTKVREWVDDLNAPCGDLDAYFGKDEKAWIAETSSFYLYPEKRN